MSEIKQRTGKGAYAWVRPHKIHTLSEPVSVMWEPVGPDDHSLELWEVDSWRAQMVVDGTMPLIYVADTDPHRTGTDEDYAAWLNIGEPELLRELARSVPPGGCIVEVGGLLGGSIKIMAEQALSTVDLYSIEVNWKNELRGKVIDQHFSNAMSHYGPRYSLADSATTYEFAQRYLAAHNNVQLLPGDSPQDFLDWMRPIDLFFTDGTGGEAHYDHWVPLVKSGGILCGHDYTLRYPGIIADVKRLSAQLCATYQVANQLWWMIKP